MKGICMFLLLIFSLQLFGGATIPVTVNSGSFSPPLAGCIATVSINTSPLSFNVDVDNPTFPVSFTYSLNSKCSSTTCAESAQVIPFSVNDNNGTVGNTTYSFAMSGGLSGSYYLLFCKNGMFSYSGTYSMTIPTLGIPGGLKVVSFNQQAITKI